MDKSSKKLGENGCQSASSPRCDLQAAVTKELAKEMMDQMNRGEGFFLELEQLQELREHLASVMSMVRLVASVAFEGRREIPFDDNREAHFAQDVYASMKIAIEGLEKIEIIIEENTLAPIEESDTKKNMDCA
jgi:hypothetical protein